MNSLQDVIQAKNELEKELLDNPKVSGVDVTTADEDSPVPGERYVIRVMVSDPDVNYDNSDIKQSYKGVPVVIEHRKIELQ